MIGLLVGSMVGFAFKQPVLGVSIGVGIGVFIGGLIEYSNNNKKKEKDV